MGRTKGSEAGNLSVTKRGNTRGGKEHHHHHRGGAATMTIAAAAAVRSGFDGALNAPWRKTVSIFKQPVTLVHTTSRDTKNPTSEQLRRVCASSHTVKSRADKPRQLFWAKSLENLCAMVPVCNADRVNVQENEHIPQKLDLASKMEPALSVIGSAGSAASLCSAIHGFGASMITGQTATKKQLESNPSINTNVDQPFIQAVTITEHDVQQQERRVLDMRKRLQEARKHFHL